MRTLMVLVMVATAASALSAQHRIDSPLRAAEVQAAPWPPPAAAAIHPGVPSETAAEHRPELEPGTSTRSQQAVLDQAFWRSVLAGVIVTVVSTLILRAIL
jgi:hypothetical protein